MFISKNDIIEKCSVSICDCNGSLYDLKEIISELKLYYDEFKTDAMSEQSLYLQGQKRMLTDIIEYLSKIL